MEPSDGDWLPNSDFDSDLRSDISNSIIKDQPINSTSAEEIDSESPAFQGTEIDPEAKKLSEVMAALAKVQLEVIHLT
jgi:hypothetical protein